MQVLASYRASDEFAVQVATPAPGQYRVLVRNVEGDKLVGIDKAALAPTEDDARFLANAFYLAIRDGSYEPKAAREAREAAERAAREAERQAAVEHGSTDEGLREMIARGKEIGAIGDVRRGEILLTVPRYAREAISARARLTQNLSGGVGSSNLHLAVNEWKSLGGDEAAAEKLERRSREDNAAAMAHDRAWRRV